ncbi:MAG: hypothetical protein ACTSU9_00485 [Promethearchaeota archaeon]
MKTEELVLKEVIEKEEKVVNGAKEGEEDPGVAKCRRVFLGRSWMMVGLMFIFAGLFTIYFAAFFSTLPLNTISSVFVSFDHILGLRFGTSTALFAIGGLNMLAGYMYMKSNRRKLNIVIIFINKPFIPLVLFIVSIILIIQTFDPSGSIAGFFAKIYGLDVGSSEVDELHYAYILSKIPKMELFVFSLACFAILPYSTIIHNIILSEYDFRLFKKKKRQRKRPTLEGRLLRRTTTHLFTGGMLIAALGGLSYILGFVMSSGLDITVILVHFNMFKFPSFPMDMAPLLLNVFPYILAGVATFCIFTGILFSIAPDEKTTTILGWIAGIILLATPFYGLFFGAFILSILYNRKKLKHERD